MPMRMTSRWTRSCVRLWRGVLNCTSGISAVEFSLLAPFMVVGAFSTVDVGRAIYDKMMINQVLRSGAHSAIAAQSEAAVRQILEDTASDNFTVAAGAPGPGELSISVSSYCVCPLDLNTQVDCSTICVPSLEPTQFYDLSAQLIFDGVMLPDITLSGEMSVLAQ